MTLPSTSAADAIPAKQPPAVTDFSEGPAENDQHMADAEVTEDQLARSNEPDFNEALSAKKTAETDSAKAPAQGQAAENQQLTTAKAGAAASGAAAMTALTATRTQAGQQVDGGKDQTKSKDEKKRAEVTARLQKVYDGTKKDVESTLSDLDKKVDTAFTAGEKSARDAFTADHKHRMKKYKDKRYSGWTGKARWVKDKFAGLPDAANELYQEARKLYVAQMQTVISSVADLIGTELGRAKARIAKGRTELKAEVDKLPADLRQFGEEAAKDFAGKFDDLEATVNEKSEQLVQDLASKYTAALNKIDEEIKKLQEANKGLIDKAKDAIVGVIKTINELKNLLLGILAKAAGAIMKIIKDPIGFLGNLVRAVGAGLNLFLTNIAEHLKTGVVSWLLGTAVKAGLELPQKFDMKGIIQLIASLLGLTWDNIKARITRKGVPDEAMAAVETSVPVAKSIASEGPAGAVKEIQAETGDLKATILEKLTSYLIPTVIIAGITWILSLLNPASAFIRAVKGIIDIVTFVVTQGAQIAEFVNSVLDAVVAIANGGQAGVPKLVEAALAASVPLLIGFLASLLGIGSLANKVKQVFHAVARPVNRAIDKIVDFIAKRSRALSEKLKPKPPKHSNGKSAPPGRATDQRAELKKRELPEAMREAHSIAQDHEKRGSSDRTLMKALKELKRRFTWIRGFEIEQQKPRSVWLLASKNKILDDWPRSLHGSGGGSTDQELVEAARKRLFGSRASVSCYYCHRLDAEAVEHIRPRNRGGDNEESNLAPVCVHCNSSKGDRVAPKTPPRGYEGKWPAPWWPTTMQVWYVMHYGNPPRYWTVDEDVRPDERFHDGTSPRIPPGSHGGSTDDSVLEEARKRIFAGRREVACMYCAKPRATAVEHIWPRNYGGDNEESNLGPSCARCNSSKGNRPAPETPPHDYSGKWPPPWWPSRMQVWWVRTYGHPKEY
ncbi:HNH endonuclease [Streptomyces sp. OR43]|uniref:HNH endonuclease n=1 Tax=Streptomyces sp. or43 TaxID=2478957 RepID=UPI0011CD6A4D|nr:HNH endonuclease [Streptomyces sp. or43]